MEYDRVLIEKEVSSINYFYLLDVSIELKKKYERAVASLEKMGEKLSLVESFIVLFTSI